jgi:molybdopterin adenylyltransferase
MDTGFRAGVLTISDKGAQGLRKDESGQIITAVLEDHGFPVLEKKIIPDDLQQIVDTLIVWVDRIGLSLIITTGGTGLSPRDLTPQAMEQIIDYEVPGMGEAMRAASLERTPHAMISRAMAGVRRACLIVNVPGSPKGARENLMVVVPALSHALSKLAGDPSDCAAQDIYWPDSSIT